ncbi:MAG TPA: cbb3-type cytochrome oxidase assembly protein CcoS [Nevskiaceae bacterium]
MSALLFLIPISMALAVLAVVVFFWAVRHDQFEDLATPGILPVLDHAQEALDAPPDNPPAGERTALP